EEGRTFYQHCTPILTAIEEAEQAVTEFHGEPRGLLKVNASTAFAQYHIEPLIPDFLARYPELRVQMTLSESIVNMIEDEVDVAVRIGQLPDSSLIARKLGSARRMVVGAPSYLEKYGVPLTPDDLKDHNCLTLSTATTFNQWEFKGLDRPRRIEVGGNFETNNAVALLHAAIAGIGLIRVGNFTVSESLRDGQLVPVLGDFETTTETNIYAVYPHHRHVSAKVRAFVDLLVEAFTPVAPWELA
ncbi:MAG: substrate binding domain-containing protein, partial [Rhodospirillales bacterium]|nr:substrate binding domain-containing protein [Rhodospirillales bacterium]